MPASGCWRRAVQTMGANVSFPSCEMTSDDECVTGAEGRDQRERGPISKWMTGVLAVTGVSQSSSANFSHEWSFGKNPAQPAHPSFAGREPRAEAALENKQ